MPDAIPSDYDSTPERFRTGAESAYKFGQGDVHESVAARILAERADPVLDVGAGEGRLFRLLVLGGASVIALDRSRTMLSAFAGKRVLADASVLPIRDGVFGAVAALYMLYHLPDPMAGLREAYRVSRPGALFGAATPSRFTDPEFADLFLRNPTPFDAEEAPSLVGQVYADVEVDTWDGPFLTLPDRSAVAEYLFGRGLDPERCSAVASKVETPMVVTRRGCVVWGRKDG